MHARRTWMASYLLATCLASLAGAGCTRVGSASPPKEEKKPESMGATGSGIVNGLRVISPGNPGFVDVTFEVQADREAHPISPLIYGVNVDLLDAEKQRWGLIRAGGNRWTAHNWENNASNAGSDYLFQNDGLISPTDEPAKSVLEHIDVASKISAATVVTLSLADYVAADKKGGGDVRKSGPDYLVTRFKRNFAKKPLPFAALPDTSDDAVYQDELVAFLKSKRPRANIIFSLDNEPELWAHTHAEIFPKPVTYEDLWKRNYDFAKAAKAAWPEAKTLGFVSYGYLGLTSLQNASDANGRVFLDWYLDQAKAAEKRAGKRLIDYLDFHWYPEAQGGGQRIAGEATNPEVVEARVQAPRSLWDRTYSEKSWIRDSSGGPIDLLHWVKAKIDAHYPGTKIAVTEWNYGGGNHISGAIAVADVLGIFGRHGVDLASYWALLKKGEPFAWAAFRAYRNFDDRGAQFGDTSISATTSDQKTTSVYASIDQRNPARTVIVAINKATSPKRAGIRITHSTTYPAADVYVLSAAKAAPVNAPPLTAVASNAFDYEMPALSVSVIVPQP